MSSLTDSTFGLMTSLAVRLFITVPFRRMITADAGRQAQNPPFLTEARLFPRPREFTAYELGLSAVCDSFISERRSGTGRERVPAFGGAIGHPAAVGGSPPG